MNLINFLKAFFELGMIAWLVIGCTLLIFGIALMYFGARSADILESSVGFIIFLISLLAFYYGTKVKNIEV